MNVYEEGSLLKDAPSCSSQPRERPVTEQLVALKDEKIPLSHYSVVAQGSEEDLKNEKELAVQVGCRVELYIH